MDRHYHSVLEKTSPVKMGSNNGYFGNYNGGPTGVNMSNPNRLGKPHIVDGQSFVLSPESESPSPPQHHDVSTSIYPNSSAHINPKDIATAISGRNGQVKSKPNNSIFK